MTLYTNFMEQQVIDFWVNCKKPSELTENPTLNQGGIFVTQVPIVSLILLLINIEMVISWEELINKINVRNL